MDYRDQIKTTDVSGKRVKIFPAYVLGRYQRARIIVQVFLIVLFLGLPWLKVNGYPVLMLDIAHRRFFLGGQLFLPQDVPGLFWVFASFALTAALASSLFGKAWCGWACPQTVFTDFFFRRIERWIDGDWVAQKRLSEGPWTLDRVLRNSAKWGIFAIAALVVSHSFLAYFVGVERLGEWMTRSPIEHPTAFIWMLALVGLFLFDLGWFREQFCLIACPYGRFQSIMIDKQTQAVSYDRSRSSDCVNCRKCVNVCPTGIDIRDGLQMECIGCTACIDACDSVMDKIGRSRGLVRYESELGLAGKPTPRIPMRTKIYGALLMIALTGLAIRMVTHESFQVDVLRATDSPYQIVDAGTGRGTRRISNHFSAKLYNLSPKDVSVSIELPDEFKAQGVELIEQDRSAVKLQTGESVTRSFFVIYPDRLLGIQGNLTFDLWTIWAHADSKIERKPVALKLLGPL